MSLLDELYDEHQKNQQEKLKQIHEHDIEQAQNLLREFHAKRYNVINVGFGSQLIKDEMGKYLDGETEFSINEMKRKKGLNYGSHEFSYQHDAVILEAINLKYINKINTLLVAPISSTKRRNSVLIEKKFYPFLERDSYEALYILFKNVDPLLTRWSIEFDNRSFYNFVWFIYFFYPSIIDKSDIFKNFSIKDRKKLLDFIEKNITLLEKGLQYYNKNLEYKQLILDAKKHSPKGSIATMPSHDFKIFNLKKMTNKLKPIWRDTSL